MKTTKTIEDCAKILDFLKEYELMNNFFWRIDGVYSPITFLANTSDLFYWAVADAEEFDVTDIELAEICIRDLKEAYLKDGRSELDADICSWSECTNLWAARKNKQRPQKACMDTVYNSPAVAALFEECGPVHTQYGTPEFEAYSSEVQRVRRNVSWTRIDKGAWTFGDSIESLNRIIDSILNNCSKLKL